MEKSFKVTEIKESNLYRDINLSLLKIEPQPERNVLPISSDIPKIGKEVLVIGHPNGMNWTQISTSITNIEQFQYDFQIGIEMNPDLSGSAVFNSRGMIAGIISPRNVTVNNTTNTIGGNYIVELLDELNITYSTSVKVNTPENLLEDQLSYIEAERKLFKLEKENLEEEKFTLDRKIKEFEKYKSQEENRMKEQQALLTEKEYKLQLQEKEQEIRLIKKDSIRRQELLVSVEKQIEEINNELDKEKKRLEIRAKELQDRENNLLLAKESSLNTIELAKATKLDTERQRKEIAELRQELASERRELNKYKNELQGKLNYVNRRESELAEISPEHFSVEAGLGIDWFYDKSREGLSLGSLMTQVGLFYRFGFENNNQTSDRIGFVLTPISEINYEDLKLVGDWYYDISLAAEFSNLVRISIRTNLVDGNPFGSDDKFYSLMASINMNDYPWPIRLYSRFESHANSDINKISLGLSIGYAVNFGKW